MHMQVTENLKKLLDEIPAHVKLVAVSKTREPEEILAVYNQSHRTFGENKAQELIAKQPQLPGDIEWHFIGHMQSNKVKYIAPFVSLIESVDRMKILAEINKQAAKNDRTIDCLLQFHIAEEETKFGLDPAEAEEILRSERFRKMNNIKICGVMGMATFTDDEVQVRKEFRKLREIFDHLKKEFFSNSDHFKHISMGMSGDYRIAIEEGSTIIRVGTAIFGERQEGRSL